MTTNPQVSAHTSYQKPRQREAVLILGHGGDNFIEAYAEKHIDVRIEICPFMESAGGEALAQEFVELSLPWRYRQLYVPNKLRAQGRIRKIRPSDIAKREWELDLLGTLDRIGKRERRRVWTL